jgi:hypothetical protein
MADYIPGSDGDLVTWLANLQSKLGNYVATLGLTAPRTTQITTWCTDAISAIQNLAQKKGEWLAASADKQTQVSAALAGLRSEIAQWKANPAMTPAIAADLLINSTGGAPDPNTYQPQLSAQAFAGYVRLKFTKKGVDGVNLYVRKQGEAAWQFLARDTNSPYDDHTPLANAGAPEVREYQAFGVINDEQVGQPSEIARATFAG